MFLLNIIISSSSNLPIYLQIVQQIKNQILNGDLKEMDPLPSIRSLAKELEISVITTKRAYDELEKEGLITIIPGKGCYIAPINSEMIREQKMRLIENKLSEAIAEAKLIDVSLEELMEIMKLLYEGE